MTYTYIKILLKRPIGLNDGATNNYKLIAIRLNESYVCLLTDADYNHTEYAKHNLKISHCHK